MKLALEYDLTTHRYVLRRSYTRPQLWRIRLWVCGEHHGHSERVEDSTELWTHQRMRVGDLCALANDEMKKLIEPYSVIEGGGMLIYRRSP